MRVILIDISKLPRVVQLRTPELRGTWTSVEAARGPRRPSAEPCAVCWMGSCPTAQPHCADRVGGLDSDSRGFVDLLVAPLAAEPNYSTQNLALAAEAIFIILAFADLTTYHMFIPQPVATMDKYDCCTCFLRLHGFQFQSIRAADF